MKTQSRGLAGSVFGSTSNIEKSIHTIGDKTAQCCAWLAKSTFLRVVRFRWVLPASLGLVQALAREACVEQLGAQAGQVFEFEIRLERSDTEGMVASHTLMQAPAAAV